MRGLFFVHLYGAFEFALTGAFTYLAQHISGRHVKISHLRRVVLTLALEDQFKAISDTKKLATRNRKVAATLAAMHADSIVNIRDDVLNDSFMSCDAAVITLAFDLYGIEAEPFYELSAKGYISEVVERRHAVAHGREAPAEVGVRRSTELRRRYDALFSEAMYVIDMAEEYWLAKHYVLTRFRRFY